MRFPARNILVLCVVGIVAAIAVGAAENDHYLPVDKSSCWECHSSWTPAIQRGPGGVYAIAVPIPPASVAAEPGKPFEYTVQIQNTWRADVTFMAPALDLSSAPSLRFAGGHVPDHNVTVIKTNPTNATSPQTPVGASTTFFVPPAASSLTFTVKPHNTDPTTGPNIALTVRAPNGDVLPSVDNNASGQPETRNITPAELEKYGSGIWRVGAQFTPLQADSTSPATPHAPVLGQQDIDVIEDAKFETAGLRVLALPRTEFLGAAASTLQTWDLASSGVPAAGETIRVYANVTGHYRHQNKPPTGDWGNFTSMAEADVIDGATVGQAGKTLIVFKDASLVQPSILNGATPARISEIIGYAAAFLLISSILSGGMFGRASRRGFNHLFGSAKRRVAFHNFLSYGLTVAALAHMLIFVGRVTEQYDITWGGLGILAMLGLGVTGALQVPMIRRWNYGTWRWTHYGMTVAAILFTVVHMLLDGTNFGQVQDYLHWKYQLFPFRSSA